MIAEITPVMAAYQQATSLTHPCPQPDCISKSNCCRQSCLQCTHRLTGLVSLRSGGLCYAGEAPESSVSAASVEAQTVAPASAAFHVGVTISGAQPFSVADDGDAPKAVGAEDLTPRSLSPPPHPLSPPLDVAGDEGQSSPSSSPPPPPYPPQVTGEYAILAAVAVIYTSGDVMVSLSGSTSCWCTCMLLQCLSAL